MIGYNLEIIKKPTPTSTPKLFDLKIINHAWQ